MKCKIRKLSTTMNTKRGMFYDSEAKQVRADRGIVGFVPFNHPIPHPVS
jgi:hypothetical protein